MFLAHTIIVFGFFFLWLFKHEKDPIKSGGRGGDQSIVSSKLCNQHTDIEDNVKTDRQVRMNNGTRVTHICTTAIK